MKNLIILLTLLQGLTGALAAADSHFRFLRLEGATTTRPYQVSDQEGNVTTVVLSDESDPVSMALLEALIRQQGVRGTFKPEKDPRGITWDQGIVLTGSFVSEPKTPASVPNGAFEGPYRDFRVSGLKVELPFARWVQTDEKDPVDSPYLVEFHLELRSLIPKGLVVDGKPVEFRNHESRSKNDQGGIADPAKPGG